MSATPPIEASAGPVVTVRRRPGSPFLLASAALLLVVAVLGCAIGTVPVPLLPALFGDAELTALERAVLVELRLPRVLLAASVGAGLAVAGAVLQGLFRNPLAEPQLIGVSSGGALGAIACIILTSRLDVSDAAGPYLLPLAAIAGALLVTSALYLFAVRKRDRGVATLLLVGIAINALAAVAIGFFTWIAKDGELRSLTYWTMGSFGGARWLTALPAMALIVLAIISLLPLARRLDLLQLGAVDARRLGVSVPKLRRRIVFGAAMAVGAGVAVSGILGFVGLVVPHVVRMLGGVHHRILLPGSALLGAVLAVLADLGARTVVQPAEMPVGLLTSAIGAPFFLWLILRMRPAR